MSKKENFECSFLDVGQGSSNIIYLGDGQAIIIDCGPGYSKHTLQFLKRYVSNIKALIISHNDADHINGTTGILANFSEVIDRIYFLDDGKYEKVFALLKKYDPEEKIVTLRIEYGEDGRGIVIDKDNIKIEIVYPGMVANLVSNKAGVRRANQTSAIIKLTYGKSCIIFSGDTTIEAWEHLSDKYLKEKPFECDIMTIPHHGGKITSGADEQKSQTKLYTKIIKPKYGIISVGTINNYKHPCPETIEALTQSGIEVLCTQMTSQCCCELEKIRSINRIIAQPSMSSRKETRTSGARNSKNVACLGTITAEVNPKEIRINQLNTHRKNMKIFNKISTFKSLCSKD